jgi:hypothetical protein
MMKVTIKTRSTTTIAARVMVVCLISLAAVVALKYWNHRSDSLPKSEPVATQ